MKHFRAYSEANQVAKKMVKRLAKGSQAAALTAGQARDALAAFERLQAFYVSTGRRVSLPASVAQLISSPIIDARAVSFVTLVGRLAMQLRLNRPTGTATERLRYIL